MMLFKISITHVVLITLLIHLIQASFTDVPPPPKRPDHFNSRDELKRYLQKVHEYHMIVGRWRLRRGFDERMYLSASNDDLSQYPDGDHDQFISNHNFDQ